MKSTVNHVTRLRALDGIRGISVLLVFFEHCGNAGLTKGLSKFFPPVIYDTIFKNGATGVGLLFVLSGLLMALLYPQPTSWRKFLQKRYTRIFPLFITVTFGLFIGRLITNNWWHQLLIVLVAAIFVHILWVNRIKKFSHVVKSRIFIAFFLFQGLIGILYVLFSFNVFGNFGITKIAEPVYLFLTWITNMTLTYFLGNSFTAFDSVYWSLVCEILFYTIYPIICVPVIVYLSPKRRIIKLLFIASLLPFFFGASRMLGRFPNINAIRPIFFFYFIVGMSLGYLYRKYGKQISLLRPKFVHWAATIGVVAIAAYIAFTQVPPQLINYYIRQLAVALPFFIVIGVLLIPGTFLGRIFSGRGVVFLGTISYSLYLSHNWIIWLTAPLFGSKLSDIQEVFAILAILVLCLIIASMLYWLLERPYFLRHNVSKKKVEANFIMPKYAGLYVCLFMCVAYVGTTTIAYNTNLTYEHLANPKFVKLLTAPKLTKGEQKFFIAERSRVSVERNKTIELLLPFFLLSLYLLYGSFITIRTTRIDSYG